MCKYMPTIADNLHQVYRQIHAIAAQAGRDPSAVQLLAVSKGQPADALRTCYLEGQRHFGENYLQEALDKQQALLDLTDICWHFIGPIQANKTRKIAEQFDWVHSVERIKIARRLSEQRNPELEPLNICLQVNICNENTKSGVRHNELTDLAREVANLPNLKLRGLMAIPEKVESLDMQRSIFRKMQQTMTELNQQGLELDTLSMGMSNDMEAAIAEGATTVRIGTAIFGPRTQN